MYNNASPLKAVSERDALKKALYKMKARHNGELKSLKTAWVNFNNSTRYKIWDMTFSGNYPQIYIEDNIYF